MTPAPHRSGSRTRMVDAVTLAAQRTSRAAKMIALQEARASFMDHARALNAALYEGRISPLIWNVEMRDLVKDLHVSAYVAGRSGRWQDMTQSDWGRVGQTLRQEYEYLRRWATGLYDLDSVSLAQLNARAKLYAENASRSFERAVAAEIGIRTDVLPAWPGERTSCMANCKCRWAFRIISKARGDYDASWRLGRAEHCPECRQRAIKWKKLRIRGGVLVDGYSAEGTFSE